MSNYLGNIFFYNAGMEAAGVVTAVGPGVNGRKVGDFVAYAGNPMGSYTEEQILPADKVVPVPPSVDPTIAASVLLKGMTAQFLVRRCYKVGLVSQYLFADVRIRYICFVYMSLRTVIVCFFIHFAWMRCIP